ncbi:MFS general substrate transporter-43 [Coleophoma crateriformis]|uniref:MFS general substrate transporter-43 n=1 Tax=Coleophoma crateriformis TaxID=565419 RepID=A0A3D8SNK5_9HELO|nr:MFS general substrate transporter-43 [Coleophoma crateriformis]
MAASMDDGEHTTKAAPESRPDMIPMGERGEAMVEKHQELTRDGRFEPRKSTLDLICVAIGLGGLQGVFAIQFGNGSEYLLSLGLSKPVMSLVWLAGPVSGAVLQPYFCLCSDECESKWGRRRPYIMGGSAAIIMCLLGQAWAQELTSAVTCLVGGDHQSKLVANVTAAMAVLLVIALNIAIQPVQGCLRAFIVDSCPKDQQDTANAWAGRIISIANVSSYFCGSIDLPSSLPFLGHTQFQVLCSITSIWLAISIAITCWMTKDPPIIRNKTGMANDEGLLRKLGRLITSFRQLPLQVQRVCAVQFFAWMGWFPFLFYMDVYVGYKYLASSAVDAAQSESISMEEAAKAGSLSMLIFAVLSLFASIFIPYLIVPRDRVQNSQRSSSWLSRWVNTVSTWMSSIRHLWMLSQVLYTACMLETMFITSVSGTRVLVGMAGISWAVTIWAPYTIISTSILADPDLHPDREASEDASEQRLGTVIGLHNVAIAVPQILAALLCSFAFWVFDGFKLARPEDGIGLVLSLGGVSALIAGFLTTRLDDGDGAEVEYSVLGAMQDA